MPEGAFSHSYSRPKPPSLGTAGKIQLALAILANMALVIMECIAFPLLWQDCPDLKTLSIFYTHWSNLLTLIISALFVLVGVPALFRDGRMPHWLKVWRLICTLQLYITWLVVAVGFVSMVPTGTADVGAMYGRSMLVMHLLAPIVSLISFLFLEGTPRLTWLDTLWGVLPTYLYTAILVPLNAAGVVDGPYDFLRVRQNPLWLSLVFLVTLLPGDWLVAVCGKLLNNGIACRISGEYYE